MAKHAYLIMAHSNFKSLARLLEAIDDERNDIYLHVDKKAKDFDFNLIRGYVKKSGIFLAPRKKIFWGHTSIVKCELDLLAMATSTDKYQYYHLLSGVDFPLKTQDYIHEYFKDKDLEYVTYFKNGDGGREYLSKVKYYYPFMRILGRADFEGKTFDKKLLRKLRMFNLRYQDRQRANGTDRTKRYSDIEFVKGDQWFSITDDLARYVLSKRKLIAKLFRFTDGPDEFFIQTIAYNSRFKEKIAHEIIREIDWERGSPYEFVYSDIEQLKSSHKLFARKICYENQPKLVDELLKNI